MSTPASLLDEVPNGLYIAGEWRSESSGGSMEHTNPATGRVQRVFPVAGISEVDESVARARQVLAGWRRWRPTDRAVVLRRIAQLMRDHKEQLSILTTLENGTPVGAAAPVPESAANWFEYYAGWVDKLNGEWIPSASGFDYTIPEPVGVVAVILTWNGPVGGIGMSVPAALAAGCCVILKPPELAPFSTNVFAEICERAGLPAGVLSILAGGPEAGDALVRHPGVDKISFTGGPNTARRIQAACAESLTPLVLELGGKSANIVLDDADIDAASARAANAVIRLSGQVCFAPTRLIVEESVCDDVTERVVQLLSEVHPGDPLDPATVMGPVISEGACDRILGIVDRARDSRAGDLLIGGERLGGDLKAGYFIAPTLFADVDNRSELAQEEVFGPVLSVIRAADEDAAVALANDTRFGLAAYVYTRDLNKAHRLAAELEAGNVAVNGGVACAGPYGPFGGIKNSGYGKEGGLAGLLEFVRIKNVNIGTP